MSTNRMYLFNGGVYYLFESGGIADKVGDWEQNTANYSHVEFHVYWYIQEGNEIQKILASLELLRCSLLTSVTTLIQKCC